MKSRTTMNSYNPTMLLVCLFPGSLVFFYFSAFSDFSDTADRARTRGPTPNSGQYSEVLHKPSALHPKSGHSGILRRIDWIRAKNVNLRCCCSAKARQVGVTRQTCCQKEVLGRQCPQTATHGMSSYTHPLQASREQGASCSVLSAHGPPT